MFIFKKIKELLKLPARISKIEKDITVLDALNHHFTFEIIKAQRKLCDVCGKKHSYKDKIAYPCLSGIRDHLEEQTW